MSLPAPMDAARQKDQLRGFAYFKSFAELDEWNESRVEPLQRSNTPLLPRPQRDQSESDGKSNVMLIHDYAGGYKKYEACQGAQVDEEWYSCEYLQYVETFVYFTHALVSIPPPSWTNACHRNGIKVLGTFLVEPGSPAVESIVEQRDGSFWVATQLAKMAKSYGFDGWLINIECQFPIFYWKLEKLEGFLRQLKVDLGPNGTVVWYDALTVINTVWYQNTLSPLNLRFAVAAGSILTNYAWTPEKAESAKTLAKQAGLPLEDVYFGIDVWAQNTQRGPNRRITYPTEGGGGTGTGLGVKELAKHGFSAGVFAPAWSFEHFPKHGKQRFPNALEDLESLKSLKIPANKSDPHTQAERAIWEGDKLPDHISCECDTTDIHTRVPYQQNPLTRYARRHPAGSASFFSTNFRRAFSHAQMEHWAQRNLRADLAQQSLLPTESSSQLLSQEHETTKTPQPHRRGILDATLHDLPTRLDVNISMDSNFDCGEGDAGLGLAGTLQLYELHVRPSDNMRFSVSYSKPASPRGVQLWLRVRRLHRLHAVFFTQEAINKGEINVSLNEASLQVSKPSGPVIGIEVHVLGPVAAFAAQTLHLLQIFSMTLQPLDQGHDKPEIDNLRLEERGRDALKHHRLMWCVSPSGNTIASDEDGGAPRSGITGLFAHFVIYGSGEHLGHAYALEFVVDEEVIERWREAGMADVRIVGIGFDGRTLYETQTVFEMPFRAGEDWIVV